ncbi:hypothetical protein FRC02_007996 [Tulasnella sp. 418]|nr:hypothetical protein FRC02_007996 [Tulasnella sp. 418]
MQRVLEACPQLQDFMLCGSATLSSNPFIRQPPVAIQLPRLQILHLDDVHPNIVRWLLESIQAPPFSKLCVDVEFYNDAEFVETLQGLPTHGVLEQAAQTVSSGKTRMVLGDDGSASWIQFGSVAHPKIRSPPPILSIYCPRDLHQLGNPIPLVSSIFPSWTKTLTILEIYDEQFYAFPENYGRIANEFLCELIELKTLVISHSRVDQSSILVALGSVKVESGIMHWPCPKLTRLELRGLLWFFADALASCVRLRYGHRLPISSQLPVPLESLQVQESCLIYNGAFHATISEIEEIIGGGIIEVEPLGAGLSHRTLLS